MSACHDRICKVLLFIFLWGLVGCYSPTSSLEAKRPYSAYVAKQIEWSKAIKQSLLIATTAKQTESDCPMPGALLTKLTSIPQGVDLVVWDVAPYNSNQNGLQLEITGLYSDGIVCLLDTDLSWKGSIEMFLTVIVDRQDSEGRETFGRYFVFGDYYVYYLNVDPVTGELSNFDFAVEFGSVHRSGDNYRFCLIESYQEAAQTKRGECRMLRRSNKSISGISSPQYAFLNDDYIKANSTVGKLWISEDSFNEKFVHFSVVK